MKMRIFSDFFEIFFRFVPRIEDLGDRQNLKTVV